jgi:hypothetical protein
MTPGKVIEGIYRDRLIAPDGRIVFDSDWKSNVIVLRCRVLLASFMKNDATAKGIQSLKIGRGDLSWDNLVQLPKPDPNVLDSLVDNAPFVMSLNLLKLEYIDPTNNDLSAKPTNRLQVTAVLGPGQPAAPDPFPLREFGLFGEMNNTEFMIDYVRHPLIEKDALMTLERKLRLAF